MRALLRATSDNGRLLFCVAAGSANLLTYRETDRLRLYEPVDLSMTLCVDHDLELY